MKNVNRAFLFLSGMATVPFIAQADVLNLFSNSGDEATFNGGGSAFTSPMPDPLAASGLAVMDPSGIGDGAAIRMWDTDTTRVTLRYHPTTSYTSGTQFNFSALIESGGPAGTTDLWRIGSSSAGLATLSNAVVSLTFSDEGNLTYNYSGGTNTVNVGLDTLFNVSLVINAAASGGSDFDYDENGATANLAPQTFAVYVNDTLLGEHAVATESPTGIGRIWWLSGGSTALAGPTMQIDNYEIRTGGDVTAVPEPSTIAAIIGLLALGWVVGRRR